MGKKFNPKQKQPPQSKGKPFEGKSQQKKITKLPKGASKISQANNAEIDTEDDDDNEFNEKISLDFNPDSTLNVTHDNELKAMQELGLTIASKKEMPTVEDDIETEDSSEEDGEYEIYDWDLKSEKEIAQAKAIEHAKDLEFARLCEVNAQREAKRREEIAIRQERAKHKKRVKRRKRCLEQNLAIRPTYNPYNL